MVPISQLATCAMPLKVEATPRYLDRVYHVLRQCQYLDTSSMLLYTMKEANNSLGLGIWQKLHTSYPNSLTPNAPSARTNQS